MKNYTQKIKYLFSDKRKWLPRMIHYCLFGIGVQYYTHKVVVKVRPHFSSQVYP